MIRNATTTIVRDGFDLSGRGFIYHATPYDDVIQTLGSNLSVTDVRINDDSCSMVAHRDGIQLIPKESEPNSQYCGALAHNITIENIIIWSNGGLQGIFASDGGFVNLTLKDIDVVTESDHKVTIAGMLSGVVQDVVCEVNLEPMRIGGNHPRAFTVGSFKDHRYKSANIINSPLVEDNRSTGEIKNFDLNLFRKISRRVEYKSFAQHFEDTLDEFQRQITKKEIQPLADVISRYEGNYRSFNRGFADDARGQVLPELITVGQLLKRGEFKLGDSRRIHASGKYQVITPTLALAVKRGIVTRRDVFTPDIQDYIFEEYLIKVKRHQVFDYLRTGKGLNNAVLALSKEWASIAKPSSKLSYYAKNNNDKAHLMNTPLMQALKRARSIYKNTRSLHKALFSV